MAIDANKLLATGVYEARLPLPALAEDLSQIDKLEVQIAAQRKKFRQIAGLALLAGLAGGVASRPLGIALLGFFGILAIAFAIFLFIYSFLYARKLYSHRDRLAILEQALKTIQHDADVRALFDIRLSLASSPTLQREEAWPGRKNGKQQFFEEDFLSVEGELLDGTAISETATELTRKRTYKNPRNKIKTKTRNRYVAAVRLTYPTDVYGDAQPSCAALAEQIRVPDSARVRDTRVTEKAIVMKALVDIQEDVAQTLSMLSLGAYRILNLARRSAASGAGGKT